MERFRRQPNETTLLKAPITYLRGEQTFKAIMFQGASMDCKAFLTSQRFVAVQKSSWMDNLGALFILVAWLVPKKIIFEIPLENLASVRYGEAKVNHELILKTMEGTEFKIRLTGLADTFGGDTRKVWIKTLSDAAKETCPEIEVKGDETTTEFIRPQRD